MARETKPLSVSVTLQTHLLLAVKPQKNKEGWDAHLSPSNGSQRESPGISSCWSSTQGGFVTLVNYGVMLLFWEIMHLKIPPAFDYLLIWGLCAENAIQERQFEEERNKALGLQCTPSVGHAGREKCGFAERRLPFIPHPSCIYPRSSWLVQAGRRAKQGTSFHGAVSAAVLASLWKWNKHTGLVAGASGTKYLSSKCFLSSCSIRKKGLCLCDTISLEKGGVLR